MATRDADSSTTATRGATRSSRRGMGVPCVEGIGATPRLVPPRVPNGEELVHRGSACAQTHAGTRPGGCVAGAVSKPATAEMREPAPSMYDGVHGHPADRFVHVNLDRFLDAARVQPQP